MIPRAIETLVQLPPADTVVTVAARSGLEVAAQASLVLLGLTLLVLMIVLLVTLAQIRGLNRTVRALGTRVVDRSGPMIDSGRNVVGNLEFITSALRTDVERLNASIKSLSERLHLASDRMEERIEEFNALMAVVQSEAESVFVDTASTVRGVRAGMGSLTGRRSGEWEEGESDESELAAPPQRPAVPPAPRADDEPPGPVVDVADLAPVPSPQSDDDDGPTAAG